jgi:RNA polymerase sigma factor (sigma-70 family)
MNGIDDSTLLREYAQCGSEEAFRQLVEHNLGLVYSTALRRVENPSLAQEVTQAVFIILARKARNLSKHTSLAGWLYQTTRLTANNALRQEIRRSHREQEAYMQTLSEGQSPEPWAQIAPLLETAMDQLKANDREAILLRFFQGKNMREVGAACGTSENAAKKRVNRALEKMRKFFSKSGVVLPSVVMAEVISANCVQAVPVGLATSVAGAALKGTTLAFSTLALVKASLKAMAWARLKLLGASVAGLICAGAAIAMLARPGSGPGSRNPQVYYAEGTSQRYSYDEQGNEIMTKGIGEPCHFYFSGSGCRWVFRLVGSTNLPGGVTEVTCDATNIYIHVPGAGGGLFEGGELRRFNNVGSIWPGVVKHFNLHLAPLWWAYGSSCVMTQDGPVPDFAMWGPVPQRMDDEIASDLILRRIGTNDLQPRVGPIEAALHVSPGQFDDRLPIAVLRPIATVTNKGIVFVTRWTLTRYRMRETMRTPNGPPEPLEKYEAVVSKFGLQDSPSSFVPKMTGSTEVQDYRFPRMETYLTDQWLDMQAVRELKRDLALTKERLRIHAGSQAPSFRAGAVLGGQVSFPDDYKGKIVLLNFWASWYDPEGKTIPAQMAVYQKYHSQGLEILGVSLDDPNGTEKVLKFCESHYMPWPQILNAGPSRSQISQQYHINGIPQVFLVDGDTGEVLFLGNDVEELDSAVENATSAKGHKK